MNHTRFCLQEIQHNKEPDMKMIKWLCIVVNLQGVGVIQRGRKASFHLALLEKAMCKEVVTPELGFRG